MARQRKAREAVALTSPQGTRVTVAKDKADAYKRRGYKAVASKKSAPKSDDDN